MKKKDPLEHFPLYCHSYMSLLSKYPYIEQGAFIRVLCGYISEDEQVWNGDAKYRLFGAFTDNEKKAVDNVYNDAIEMAKNIIKKQKALRQINRDNGKKGGRPRNP